MFESRYNSRNGVVCHSEWKCFEQFSTLLFYFNATYVPCPKGLCCDIVQGMYSLTRVSACVTQICSFCCNAALACPSNDAKNSWIQFIFLVAGLSTYNTRAEEHEKIIQHSIHSSLFIFPAGCVLPSPSLYCETSKSLSSITQDVSAFASSVRSTETLCVVSQLSGRFLIHEGTILNMQQAVKT